MGTYVAGSESFERNVLVWFHRLNCGFWLVLSFIQTQERNGVLGTYWYPPRGLVTVVPLAKVVLERVVAGHNP